MRTTVKLKLRASKRMLGCGVLTLQVTRRRITRTATTSCVLSLDEWDESRQKIIFQGNISQKRKKELAVIEQKLKKDLKRVGETIKHLEDRGDYTSQDLVRLFRERRKGQMFCEFVFRKTKKLQQEGRFGTAHAYRYAGVSFLKFLKERDICINKIDAVLIKDYERYLLSQNKSMNTISCYMRSLRAVYNEAIREKIFVLKKTQDNPFLGVFTGNAKTRKRAVSGESISRLAKLELSEVKWTYPESDEVRGINSPEFSRDLFLFSVYTQGMPFSDMVNLKKENVGDGFIRYNRKKTGQLINIELEDCMKEIIERYSDKKSEFIFPILKNFKDKENAWTYAYEKWKKAGTALGIYNKNLSRLARLAGIGERLTSYVARHSWATMASQEGIPIATISRGLGHESEKTTQIYISRADYSDVKKANRKILSRIHSVQPCT